ncbi:hypothetical protein Fmac_024510 [Flemingia macrophylla]|uniref:Uncharacterized protein n=1 Tax=Flemingia macrophylla TaxID=520843 RepID=A0ABD1LPL4_9FABA
MDESPPQQPPKPEPPTTTNLPPSPLSRRSFCRLCCYTTCIVLLILIAANIFYLIYERSLPQFCLTSFLVPTLNVTESTVDGPYLNTDTTSRVELRWLRVNEIRFERVLP